MSVQLLDFYADWCGPCKTQDPILENLEDEYEAVSFEKIDVEEDEEKATDYNVRSLPTIIIEVDGEVFERCIGVTQHDELASILDSALNEKST